MHAFVIAGIYSVVTFSDGGPMQAIETLAKDVEFIQERAHS